jgi:hypothetical protein
MSEGSLLDGKPQVATEKHVALKWGGRTDNFRCRLCGHSFKVGDVWRFVFANFPNSGVNHGNFMVCVSCDGADVLARAAAQEVEAKQRFWWFGRRE